LRILAITALLAVALAGPSQADRLVGEGKYDVYIVATPELTPPEFPFVGPDIYKGDLNIKNLSHSVEATFRGKGVEGCSEGKTLKLEGEFMEGWGGVLLGSVTVDGVTYDDVIVGMDVAWMNKGELKGEGKVLGLHSNVKATFGMGGEIERLKITPKSCDDDDDDEALQESSSASVEGSSWSNIKTLYR
jgi:hypothetical protein